MRISDWSSDVCSSDLWIRRERAARPLPDLAVHLLQSADVACRLPPQAAGLDEIAPDRDAVCGVFPFRFARQTLPGPARIRLGFVIAQMRDRRRRTHLLRSAQCHRLRRVVALMLVQGPRARLGVDAAPALPPPTQTSDP